MKKLFLAFSVLALIAAPSVAREIAGATVTVSPTNIPLGVSELEFFVQNASSDAEWIGHIGIVLPDCMTIVAGTDHYTDPDGSWYALPTFSIQAPNIGFWDGWTTSGYGFIGSTDNGYFYFSVDNACPCNTTQLIHWELQGDGWGSDPHFVEGDLEVFIECVTAVETSTFSAVKALY